MHMFVYVYTYIMYIYIHKHLYTCVHIYIHILADFPKYSNFIAHILPPEVYQGDTLSFIW